MTNTFGLSAPPLPTPPDVPPTPVPGATRGISAAPGYQGPPPPIDPAVAATKLVGISKHGTG